MIFKICIGLLSMFAARAGARKVYAVESSNIAMYTQQAVIDNNLGNVITVIHDDICNLRVLPCIVVDIIIFDWRGKSVLNKQMLKSIMHARDMFLRTDGFGIILPDTLKVYLCGMDYESIMQEKVSRIID